MPKKVTVAQLRVGMYLQRLEGKWLDHPFWRPRFLIRTEAELQKLRDCGVQECWIDPSKGEDVEIPLPGAAVAVEAQELALAQAASAGSAATVAAPASEAAPSDAGVDGPAEREEPVPTSTDFVTELASALGVRERARAAVMAIHEQVRTAQPIDLKPCLASVQEIGQSLDRNSGALVSLLRLKRHDDYFAMHAVSVCALMMSLAHELKLDRQARHKAGVAGMLLNIGAARLPLELLNKPCALTDEEKAVMQTHPAQGHELLKATPGVPPEALDACLHHHERLDGSGYPEGLVGDSVSYLARMSAICDVYDAVTSHRPYKCAWDPAEAIAQMASWKGHFDPAIFSAFVRCLGIYPTGSLVRLQSDRLAVVLEQNPGAMSEPVVRVFFCTQRRQRISPVKLDLKECAGEDYIIGRESVADWPVGNIEALWSHGHATQILGTGALAGQPTLTGTVRE